MRLDSGVRPPVRLHSPLVLQSQKAAYPTYSSPPTHSREDEFSYVLEGTVGVK
jgi:hypothetical protein